MILKPNSRKKQQLFWWNTSFMPHHRKIGPSTHATSTAPLPGNSLSRHSLSPLIPRKGQKRKFPQPALTLPSDSKERPKNIWWNNNLMPHHGNTEPSIHATDPAAFPEIPSTGTHCFPCNFQEMRKTVLAENDLARPCQAGRPGRCKAWRSHSRFGFSRNRFSFVFFLVLFCARNCATFRRFLCFFFSVLSFVFFLVLLCAWNCATFRKFVCFFSSVKFCAFSCATLCSELCYFSEILVLFF